MLRTNYELSEDANNYYLQNVECHCEISSRSPKFAKRAIMNLTDVSKRCFCPQQKVPACDLTHGCVTTLSESQGANFPTSPSFYSCVTMGRESSVYSACL